MAATPQLKDPNEQHTPHHHHNPMMDGDQITIYPAYVHESQSSAPHFHRRQLSPPVVLADLKSGAFTTKHSNNQQ